MLTALVTQNKRVLTNTWWCHHFLPQDVSKRRSGQPGRQDQRPGTSPTSPLFLSPFRYNLKECTCHSVPTAACILLLGWDFFFQVSRQSTPLGPTQALGSVPTQDSSDPPQFFPRHSQDPSFSLNRLIHLPASYQGSPATLSRPRHAAPETTDSCPKGRVGSPLEELTVTSCPVSLIPQLW